MNGGSLCSNFWVSRECQIMVNLRDHNAVVEADMLSGWVAQQESLAGHLLFATSGSTGVRKWAALSYDALLGSARVVNRHLVADKNDRWLLALPDFHVGGIGVSARCHEAGCMMHTMPGRWDPMEFHRLVSAHGITLTSLVPAQLFDLVHAELKAPKSLRVVLVGGGALNDKLYERALSFGWPVMETYGMTEACSQIATAALGSRDLHVLPAWQARVTPEKHLVIKGEMLLSAYVSCDGGACKVVDPKVDGWFDTGDMVSMKADKLKVLGRASRCVKILGELVSLEEVERELVTMSAQLHGVQKELAVVAIPDPRRGSRLIICSDEVEKNTDALLSAYNRKCLPVHRVDQFCLIGSIPRSALGKIIYPELCKIVMCHVAPDGGIKK